jgi:hypothetical protein
MSPFCEFDFSASRARSIEYAASVLFSVPTHSVKIGHSCSPQRRSAVEATIRDETDLGERAINGGGNPAQSGS